MPYHGHLLTEVERKPNYISPILLMSTICNHNIKSSSLSFSTEGVLPFFIAVVFCLLCLKHQNNTIIACCYDPFACAPLHKAQNAAAFSVTAVSLPFLYHALC